MVNEVVDNHEVSGSNPSGDKNAIVDFFASVLALVDRVAWYLLLVGGGKYP